MKKDKIPKHYFKFEWLSEYRGVLMGVETISIVIFHLVNACRTHDLHYTFVAQFIYKYIGSSGVDVFLILSGIGLYFSWKKNQDYLTFYKKRYLRIIVPYIIIAVIGWGIRDLVFDNNIVSFFKDVTFITFFTEGERWFWYVLMIAVCYFIFPYVFDAFEKAEDYISEQMRLLFLCLFNTIIVVLLELYYENLYNDISVALLRFTPFFLGCYWGKIVFEKRKTTFLNIFIFIILSFIIAGPLGLNSTKILMRYSLTSINISICFLIIYLFEYGAQYGRKLKKVMNYARVCSEKIGEYSFEVYLCHVMIFTIMNELDVTIASYRYGLLMLLLTAIMSPLLKKVSELIIRI